MRGVLLLSCVVLFAGFLVFVSGGVGLAVSDAGDSGVNVSGLLVQDSIFLRVGESWSFYQGYVLSLRDVSDDGVFAWLQLSQEGVVVDEWIAGAGDVLMFNRSVGGENVTVFRIVVDGVFANPEGYLVTLSPVSQFFDPSLPMSTPVSVNRTPVPVATPVDGGVQTPVPPYVLVLSALLVVLITLYIMKKI